jgi:prepilin-type processing-associated H-X9-DG protein
VKVFACPSLKQSDTFPSTPTSETSTLANQLVLDRKLSGIPKAATVAVFQEHRARSAYGGSEPEWYSSPPWYNADVWATGPATYTQWHTYIEGVGEYMSNAHEKGGNLVFCDGHVAYSKYQRLTSLDFGLVDMRRRVVKWLASEASSRQEHQPAF